MSGRTSTSAGERELDVDALAVDARAVRATAHSARAVMFMAWGTALLALLLLDVTFNQWFWRIPKLTPASADYGYQFLTNAHALATTPKRNGVPRVIAIGSSVAGSFDPAHLLNPSFERDLKPQVRAVLPPAATLRERGAFIATVAGKLDLAVAAVSNLYRYRAALRSCIEDHLRWAWRWLRAGRARGGFGWYPDGYTRQDFAVPVAAGADGFEYYIDPDWIRQRGQVTLTISGGDGVPQVRTESAPGWQRIPLPPGVAPGDLLSVAADSTWSPRAAGRGDDTRLLGVRLRAVPDAAASRERAPVRYPPLERDEPDTLLRMQGASGDEFATRWQALLDADTDFGRRFRAYRDSKVAERETPVRPTGEYAELEHLVQEFTAHGARVLLINNPESDLLRGQYADSPYYRSYVDFLSRLAAHSPGAEFHDLAPALPIDDFNDWHHVTYIGAIKLGPTYAALVQDALAAPACR